MNSLQLSNELCSVRFAKGKQVTFSTNWRSMAPFIGVPRQYRVIGKIYQDMAFGLLAVDPDGGYVRINGHIIEPLKMAMLNKLLPELERAKKYRNEADLTPVAVPQLSEQIVLQSAAKSSAVITVRKRRTIQRDSAASHVAHDARQHEGMHLAQISQYFKA